jgi:hypothetical protein
MLDKNTKEVNLTPGGQFSDDGFVIEATQEEFEASASKFPDKTGMILSEMGMPQWKQAGKSLDFPFTIIEEGPDKGKEGHIYTSLQKFSLEPVLNAVGVPITTTADGKPKFDHMAVVGKQFLSYWIRKKDTRTAEEGGTGKITPYCNGAYPVGTKEESLGI